MALRTVTKSGQKNPAPANIPSEPHFWPDSEKPPDFGQSRSRNPVQL